MPAHTSMFALLTGADLHGKIMTEKNSLLSIKQLIQNNLIPQLVASFNMKYVCVLPNLYNV